MEPKRAQFAGWMLVIAAAGVACGDDGPECGEGTVAMDGRCVPESMVDCGDGTVAEDGTCLPDPERCGAGTSFDEAAGECVSDLDDCGPGTVAMSGRCVPDGSVICTGNTTFDVETGTCVVTGEACGEGTVLIDGECVPNDETLVAEVEAAAEPDDPLQFDGSSPGSFTTPAIGEERTLEGCITPADFDEDGIVDVDFDVFRFTVDEPGLFRVNADGLGGMAAAFGVVPVEPQRLPIGPTEGPLAEQGFVRYGLGLGNDSSERRFYLPFSGDFYLVVFDARSFDLGGLFVNQQLFSTPVGGEETCYFVTVEAQAVPEPTEITAGQVVSADADEVAFFTLAADERSLYLVDGGPESEAPPGFTVFEGSLIANETYTPGFGYQIFGFSPIVPAEDELLVVVDSLFVGEYVNFYDYEFVLVPLPEVPSDGTVSLTQEDEPGSGRGNLLWVEAQEGDVIHLTATSSTGAALDPYVADPVETFRARDALSLCPFPSCFPGPSFDTYHVAERSGPALLVLFNQDDPQGTEFDVALTRRLQTPPTLTAGTASVIDLVDTRTFARVDTSANVWTAFALSDFQGAGFSAADAGLHLDTPSLLAAPATAMLPVIGAPTAYAAVDQDFGLVHGPDGGMDMLVELSDPAGFDGDERVELVFGPESFVDLTVDPETPVSRSADTIPADGVAYYLVRALVGGEVTFEVTGTGGTDPVVSLLNPNVTPAEVVDDTGADGTETAVAVSEGWLSFAVQGGEAGGTVDVSITQVFPPYTDSVGSTTYESICPSSDGTGTQLIARADEATASRTLSTFTGFSFFDEPVTGFVVSTNGWLTFDESYSGSALRFESPLGDPTEPNALVAAQWFDVTSEVCVLEEADQLIVEWRGDFFGFLFMRMQAIFDQDGSIELVYGPGHTLNPLFGVVGLENADGTDSVGTSLPVAPSTSILFTPPPP
ncbi:MAG TPA: hypothetical protein RMF84_18070 [Polyangiaceae bacterium LLY-WYZ-14_1]|nr:hypothetical protein [Polyangiaceae bacterium LLY-WYZ-14_1]